MLERIERRLARFIEPPGDASALALTLLGALQAFTTPDQAAAGLELLREALRQQPEDGRLRNLVAMAELRQCCAGDGTGPALKQVPQMLLAGLAVDPNNTDLLANLQATYAWLAGQPGGDVGETGALATGVVRVNANLRAGPSTDAPVVGLAPRGSRIKFTGTDASGHWLRVDRGAEPDAFVAARLVQDLEPSGLECGRDIALEVCAALRAGPQDAQEFSKLPELFRTLEGAQTGTGEAIPSRLAAAGLTAAEVDARLAEVKQLRHALGRAELTGSAALALTGGPSARMLPGAASAGGAHEDRRSGLRRPDGPGGDRRGARRRGLHAGRRRRPRRPSGARPGPRPARRPATRWA